jgi:hypothetical protein
MMGLTNNVLPLAGLEPASYGAVRRSLGLGLGWDRIPGAAEFHALVQENPRVLAGDDTRGLLYAVGDKCRE